MPIFIIRNRLRAWEMKRNTRCIKRTIRQFDQMTIIHHIIYLHIHGLLVLNLYSNSVGFALECFGCLALLSKENHGWKWNNASKFLFNTIVLYVEPLLYHLHVHFSSILKSLTPFCTLLNFVCIIRCRHHGEDYCNTQRGCKK